MESRKETDEISSQSFADRIPQSLKTVAGNLGNIHTAEALATLTFTAWLESSTVTKYVAGMLALVSTGATLAKNGVDSTLNTIKGDFNNAKSSVMGLFGSKAVNAENTPENDLDSDLEDERKMDFASPGLKN